MSIAAINEAYKIKAGSARNKAVLIALANHANDDGKCWPRISTLATETELSERAVQMALADLEKRGLIGRQPQYLEGTRYHRANLITLHLGAHDQRQDEQRQDGAGDAPHGAGDAPYGAPDAPYMVQEQHQHGAGDAPHIEPSSNRKEEPSKNHTRALAIVDQSFDKEFDDVFWPAYPDHVGKKDARRAFVKARKAGTSLDTIMQGLDLYKRTKPEWKNWKSPAAWLNGERWSDEVAPARASAPKTPGGFCLKDSDRWKVWRAYYRATRNIDPPEAECRIDGLVQRGWDFDTELPPPLPEPAAA